MSTTLDNALRPIGGIVMQGALVSAEAIPYRNQYLHQLEPDIRHAVLGNAGTLVSFRLGARDAPHLAREFDPVFSATDLVNLPNYAIYLKLMIDGTPSRPFSATTLPPMA
ncbi:MAG: hypothetical protein AB2784_07955 [Candidatus Thiodiazotropha endolucinida]